MAEFVVNIVLILTLLVLLTAALIGALGRRRRERRQHAEERRLILQAFLAAAAEPTKAAPEPPGDATRMASAAVPHQLDAASVARLLDLLEDRRPARRGALTGLVSGPRGVWAAGARAGQHVVRRTLGQRADATEQAGPQLVRAAARELLDIHAHDPSAAHLEYRRYAAALGDPALAELYVRSAAYGTYAEHDHVRQVVEQIVSGPQLANRPSVKSNELA
jgi:hypothetical protein